jgi:hypothetical protein
VSEARKSAPVPISTANVQDYAYVQAMFRVNWPLTRCAPSPWIRPVPLIMFRRSRAPVLVDVDEAEYNITKWGGDAGQSDLPQEAIMFEQFFSQRAYHFGGQPSRMLVSQLR